MPTKHRAHAPRKASKYSHPVSYTAGPFQGMVDSPSPKLQKPNLATNLHNVVPDISGDGGVIGRPGFDRISATQMGSGGVRNGQAVIFHVAEAGTHYTFFVCGGKMYRVSWPSTLTDVTPVDVTISSSATQVYGVSFGDNIIVTDGVNRPWKASSLASTPIVGTYLTGVDAAVLGPPAVYYAKLFFIKSAEQNTIIWSEENDPDTGYEAGDYNNAWTLTQTSNQPLTRLYGMNDELIYWRSSSMGAIHGAVTTDFVNAGVHDSISQTVGTRSPAAVVAVDRTVYFLDQNSFPHKYTSGDAAPVPLWSDVAELLAGPDVAVSTDILHFASAAYSPDLDMVITAHPRHSVSFIPSRAIALHAPTDRWFGTWGLPETTLFRTMGLVTPIDGSTLAPEEQRLIVLDNSGWAYKQMLQQENDPWDRLDGSTALAVDHTVTTPVLGYSETVQQQFDQVDVTVRGFASNTPTYTVTWATPRTAGTTQNLAPTAPVAANRDVKGSVGINAYGRGVSITIAHSSATTRFSLHHVRVSGTAVSDAPGQY